MKIRRLIAIWTAKIISTICRISGRQGVTLAGKIALKIDPTILGALASQVREKIFVVCGTNGKTTTNNLLCAAIESEGKKLVCNHTGSNMLQGIVAAFVLAAKNNGTLDADYACLEVDEASTLRIFPHFKPDYMILTNLFRDQLDRYGEIDITMEMLGKAMKMAPEMTVIVNGDDSLSAYLAQKSGNPYKTYGITEQVFSYQSDHEIRDGSFCKKCGAKLEYEFYHYGQLGRYHCPNCDFTRPKIDFEAAHIDLSQGLEFDVVSGELSREEVMGVCGEKLQESESDKACGEVARQEAKGVCSEIPQAAGSGKECRHIYVNYKGFYNIYNVLAAYSAVRTAGLEALHFDEVLQRFHPQNGRMEAFEINGTKILLNLAKNPAGFNQNIQAVMEDKEEKDIIIAINDNAADGTDISWLWDVDFDRFADPEIRTITTSGIRCLDMQLRLKYVDVEAEAISDVKQAIEKRIAAGDKNLYVLVNYTALFTTRDILLEMQK